MSLLALAMIGTGVVSAAQVTYTTYAGNDCFGATQGVFQSSDTSDCVNIGQTGSSVSYAAGGLASECTTLLYHDAACQSKIAYEPSGISRVRIGFSGCFEYLDVPSSSGGQDLYAQTTCPSSSK